MPEADGAMSSAVCMPCECGRLRHLHAEGLVLEWGPIYAPLIAVAVADFVSVLTAIGCKADPGAHRT